MVKLRKKQSAVAFIDYEHWYYSYRNKFDMVPNIEEWYDEVTEEYHLKDLYVYGDFSGRGIEQEIAKLERFTKNVIHTSSMKDGVDKDFTDFIILDAIYRTAAQKKSPEVYIIFTGDGHFDLAVQYLKSLKKKVIIYAVKYALSNKLKSSATAYVEMPRQSQQQLYYLDMIIKSLKYLDEKGKVASYYKTIQNVASHNRVAPEKVKTALDFMILQKYLTIEEAYYKGKKHRILKADWERMEQAFGGK